MLTDTKKAILQECESIIKKRPDKPNHALECIAIFRKYQLLSGDPGSPIKISNSILAHSTGLSRRIYIMKKKVGKSLFLNKGLLKIIREHPVLNHFKLLYHLASRNLSPGEGEVILHRILSYIQAGLTIENAMFATGLLPKQMQNSSIEVPSGKVPIFVYREIAEKAEDALHGTGLTLAQQTEILLHSEIMKKKTGKNAMMHRSHF
ncbi:hypothetical protein C4588_05790 [Candidatus Parcubacteria bacterium]|nr:MAG: hypothetical protein C4588_05790 [Candidatus Parcubacteria bacterium]